VVAGLVGVAIAAWGSGGPASANHLGLAHLADPQVSEADVVLCRGDGIGDHDMDGSENASAFPVINCVGEDSGAGSISITQTTAIILHRGNRIALPFTYSDDAFVIPADGDAPALGTTVGGVKALINIGCDGSDDAFIDDTSAPITFAGGTPEPFVKRTIAWGPGTGIDGQDESYLDASLPPFAPHVRYRADVDFVTFGGNPFPLVNKISLNSPILDLPWGTSKVSTTLLGGDPNAPSAQTELCLDSPQSSISTITGYTNPPAGLYAAWTVQLGTAGIIDEQVQHVTITTSCKHIGGTVDDDDNDCWDGGVDTNDTVADQDGDGLLDGIEVSWAGAACVSDDDCDNDGRTDLEEIIGPTPFLTNPLSADTDSDGFLDSGFNVDCDGDGNPDAAPVTSSGGVETGRNRSIIAIQYCKPDGVADGVGLNTTSAGLGGRPWGNLEAASEDNCPNIDNDAGSDPDGAQSNFANVMKDLDALPAPGDSNGRFNTTADISQPDGRFNGNMCSGDDDQDGIPDQVEDDNFNFDSGAADAFCNTDGTGPAVDTDRDNRDTDGDGATDGFECELAEATGADATNPDDDTSKPPSSIAVTTNKIFFRIENLVKEDLTVQTALFDGEPASTSQPAVQVRQGISPSSWDTDRDGCADTVEMADIDGNGSVADPDRIAAARAVLLVGAFAPPPAALTDEEVRTVDIDGNGSAQDADRILIARVVLTGSVATVLNFNLTCNAATIGALPN
jgi:hypothetical protein